MQYGCWKLACDEWDRRTLECTKPGFDYYSIKLSGIRNSATMLDWIFQIYHKKDVIGPQEMYDLLTAFDEIFKPQANLCPGGNDRVIEQVGE